MEIIKNSWNKLENERKLNFWKLRPQTDEIMLWVSLFRQEATKYRHVYLPTIIKEIQTGLSRNPLLRLHTWLKNTNNTCTVGNVAEQQAESSKHKYNNETANNME